MFHRIATSLKSPLLFSKGSVILFGLLGLILIAANVALFIQNLNLKARTTDSAIPLAVKIGSVVPALSGFDIYGKEFTLEYANDSRKAILFIFSPDCGFCTKNMPNWKKIIDRVDRRSYHLVAVSIKSESSGVKEYVDQQGLSGLTILTEVNLKNKLSYEMRATPQTLVIDHGGRVEKVWTGVIEAEEWQDVERTLNLKLVTALQ
jgi:peroxiredoxin